MAVITKPGQLGHLTGFYHGTYDVLEPMSTEASPEVTDLLANLARRVTSLETQLRATQRNLETTAEELANARHRLAKHSDRFAAVEDKVERLNGDICELDDRSQVLNAINKYYAEGSR
jgi:chromosome segregation ATPase